MIYTKIAFILLIICPSFSNTNNVLTYSYGDEYNEEFITKIFKYNRITLKSKSPIQVNQFEPKFYDRLILINDKFLINVDSICTKSELFNESFNFYPNCIKVKRDCKNKFKLTVYLGQEGCVGDFCKDLIEFNIVIFDGKLNYQFTDVSSVNR